MELLEKLYSIHSPSGREKKMKKFVKNYIRANVPGAIISNDNAGNIYVVKGKSDTYPCLAAHLDQVQKAHSHDFTVLAVGDTIFGYSPSRRCTEGLGADDKNGIWIALRCLETFDVLKVAFFVGEETGCIGSSQADMDFFKDCRFVIEPDRRGGHDFIQSMSYTQVCSDEFRDATGYKDFGYELDEGLLTDVLCLVESGVGISCINLSCGYYNPHTDEESTSWSELNNCLSLVCHIIETCTDVYPHTYMEYDWSKWDWGRDDAGWNSGKTNVKKLHEPVVLHASDYPDAESYIMDMLYVNPYHDPENLWPYMSSELETFGWSAGDFYQFVF